MNNLWKRSREILSLRRAFTAPFTSGYKYKVIINCYWKTHCEASQCICDLLLKNEIKKLPSQAHNFLRNQNCTSVKWLNRFIFIQGTYSCFVFHIPFFTLQPVYLPVSWLFNKTFSKLKCLKKVISSAFTVDTLVKTNLVSSL